MFFRFSDKTLASLQPTRIIIREYFFIKELLKKAFEVLLIEFLITILIFTEGVDLKLYKGSSKGALRWTGNDSDIAFVKREVIIFSFNA